jgi:hypothetical protein
VDWFRSDIPTLEVGVVAAEAVELDDLDTFIVAFSSDKHGEHFALAFEVGLNEPDDQDRRLKQDAYCITDHIGRCVYEGIKRWSSDSDALQILVELTDEAAEVLAIPVQVRLQFAVEREKWDQLVLGMERVFTSFIDVSRQPLRVE